MDKQNKIKNSSQSTPEQKDLPIIGNSVRIKVAGVARVPAKIDTGASVSSIWASDIQINSDNQLEFYLFASGSEFYTGEKITVDDYQARLVRNSTGQESVRYTVTLPTVIKHKRIRISYTLADRSRNNFPVLIGRRALKNKFLVDVSKLGVPYPDNPINDTLNQELSQDPQKFHQKYMASKKPSAKS